MLDHCFQALMSIIPVFLLGEYATRSQKQMGQWVSITVNGKNYTREVEPRTLLASFLREDLGLTGTNIGCDSSQCGACTIHMDGMAVKSCTVLAVQAHGTVITTIEGMAVNGKLHPVQQAFWDQHGLQCGFCTPGMIMSISYMLAQHPNASELEIRHQLEGNICRCTGYQNIVKAAMQARDELHHEHHQHMQEQH